MVPEQAEYVWWMFNVPRLNWVLFWFADLSKNRFTEIPPEVCLFAPLESLNLYHNCIKCIPEAIINLQMLTYLDIRWATAKCVLSVWLLCGFVLIQLVGRKCWFPISDHKQKILTRHTFPYLLKLFSQWSDIRWCMFSHAAVMSMFDLSPQSKSAVSLAKILVQPPP